MADWHPMLATEERTPGVWTMVAPDGVEYGRVEIRRAGDAVFYRCWFRDVELEPTRTLREAAARVHGAFIATMSPGYQPGKTHPGAQPPRP